ncbi:nuclear transport factor 2 family protein [Deinococcus apachensis]|uniref:nuclear transport factor 2 family protein n=1 Tax=Deinococcus apachensis TaxID=309886 RepID=UPI00035CF8B5|nr:nuclear transport factor 2 family protein [Deinococcus apachensis]
MTTSQERTVLDMFATANKDGLLAAASFYAGYTHDSGREVGRAGVERVFADIAATSPDAYFHVDQVVSHGERVAVRASSAAPTWAPGAFPSTTTACWRTLPQCRCGISTSTGPGAG